MVTPVTVVTGYLGAGKTSFVQHALEHADREIAVVMNEFGDVNIDAEIIEQSDVDVAELENGCVCCAVTGMFTDALEHVVEKYTPDLVVVECSGAAAPGSVARIVAEEVDDVFLDSVVAVADAYALNEFESLGETGREQFRHADVIVLNKTDLVNIEEEQAAVEQIRNITPDAPIIPAVDGEVDLHLVLGYDTEVSRFDEDGSHVHSEEVMRWTGSPVDRDGLWDALERLPEAVYRVKGFATVEDTGTVLVQYAFGRTRIEPWDKHRDRSELVVIGDHVTDISEEVQSVLSQCEVDH